MRTDNTGPGISANNSTRSIEPIVLLPDGDVDGDMVKNSEEKILGRNPYVAELPQLDIKFLQNYKITMTVASKDGDQETEIVIDTKVGRDDPSFQYRIGNIFARHNTYKTMANIGRFDGHTWGEIQEHDLSWVKYPEIDPIFYHNELLKNKNFLNEDLYQIKNIKIEIENSVNLVPFNGFKEICNLVLSFYYFNYEKDSYELLGNFKAEQHFKAGVRETVNITIENVPVALIKDNFFTKGEFIISEVTEYEIPETKIKYQTLLKSISEKSIPVVVNTPNETTVYYVGVDGKEDSFLNILDRIYPNKVQIHADLLTKLEQFENNLPAYTYLQEIKDKDKKGKWFVFTNKLEKHYLDHGFTPKDRIYVSYITGSELANQKDETIHSYRPSISGQDEYEMYPLGNILPNSRVDVQIRPLRKYGEKITNTQETWNQPRGSCGPNCIVFEKNCRWDINLIDEYNENLTFGRNLGGEADKIELVLNDESFSLSSLVNEDKIKARWKNGNLHLIIEDISKIKNITNFNENILYLKIKTEKQFGFWGVKLVEVGGHWQGPGGCPYTTPAVAFKFKSKYISNETMYLDETQWVYNNVLNPEGRSWVSFKDSETAYQRIDISVSSTIQNFFN